MSIKNLDAFFNPRRIAVLGASEDEKVLGYHVFRNLIGKGFKGWFSPQTPTVRRYRGVEILKNNRRMLALGQKFGFKQGEVSPGK
jgi:acetyltransferase